MPATRANARASTAASASTPDRRGSVNGFRIQPSLDEFRALAGEHTVVPVWTELLADLETPVAAYAKLVGDGTGFLLESVEHGERWSRFSFVGRDPTATLILRDGTIVVDGEIPDSGPPQVLLDLVEAGHLGQKTGQGFYTYPREPAAGQKA